MGAGNPGRGAAVCLIFFGSQYPISGRASRVSPTTCDFRAPVRVYPGEMEQEALAMPALKVMRGELKPLTYTGKPVWDGFPGISFD